MAYRAWFLDQLAMYAAYHRDRRNQATHHIGVPLIVFALLAALTQIPLTQLGGVAVTGATAVLAALLMAYVAAVPLIGAVTAVFYAVVYVAAVKVAALDAAVLWAVAIAAFVIGWAIQFIGHAFEGRRPALTVNLLQIFMAPPFLIAEMMFGLGLAKGLEAQLQTQAVKYAA